MKIRNLVPFESTGHTPSCSHGPDFRLGFPGRLDRVFSELTRGFGDAAVSPALDVLESDEEIRVDAELPGVTAENVEITLDRRILSIKGEKKSEETSEGESLRHVERSFGSFQRTLRLPCDVDLDSVKASCEDGILCVRLPKSKSAQKRTISIESGK